MGQLDPDRQLELDEILAAVTAAESPPDNPIRMYLREVASTEPLSLDKEAELLAEIRRGDEAARLKLTEVSLWEVVRMARAYTGRGVPLLDLVQEGNLGLMRAVSEVPSEHESFSVRRDALIRQAIEHAL